MVDLLHHGDAETGSGLLDFAVNVFPGPRPRWLDDALRLGLDDAGDYPSATSAEAATAARHARDPGEVLATAGAAEAFDLVARLRAWRRPVVVHPQFTEPHAALERAGHHVTVAPTDPSDGFALDPATVPHDADLVCLGNPTNPTGALHDKAAIRDLLRPGRLVVVDEAFMDAVPGEPESLDDRTLPGLLVVRSLTKHWGIPGIRAGYLLAEAALVADLRRAQVPWSVSAPAATAMVACSSPAAVAEAERRAATLVAWRGHLEAGLDALGVRRARSHAPFVLAEVGNGVHGSLRERAIAVRRADTFPGLGPGWVRIAARPPDTTDRLLDALDTLFRHTSRALG